MSAKYLIERVHILDDISSGLDCSYDGMHKLYSLTGEHSLYKVFPSVQRIRAGILLIRDNSLLLVRQRELVCFERGKKFTIPSYLGPPKGRSDRNDTSALETAERELLEETGVDVHDPALNARLSPAIFVYPRDGSIFEIILYFVVAIDINPTIVHNDDEIIGYGWFSLDRLIELKEVSMSTGRLLQEINMINFNDTSWIQIPARTPDVRNP